MRLLITFSLLVGTFALPAHGMESPDHSLDPDVTESALVVSGGVEGGQLGTEGVLGLRLGAGVVHHLAELRLVLPIHARLIRLFVRPSAARAGGWRESPPFPTPVA
jgi:hypothetical protein